MIVKLYMGNVFYRVNLVFLSDVLQKIGFSKKEIDIIKGCIIGPWIAPLVNGKPSKFSKALGVFDKTTPSPLFYISPWQTH